MTDRHVGPKPRACGCKGIRSCRICETTSESESCSLPLTPKAPLSTFNYCQLCQKAWRLPEYCGSWNESNKSEMSSSTSLPIHSDNNQPLSISGTDSQRGDSSGGGNVSELQGELTEIVDSGGVKSVCNHGDLSHVIDFEGIVIVENFVTECEEALLDSAISESHFVNSQSGRRKQDYGPKVNFKKQKLNSQSFKGLPLYSRFLYERMKAHPHLSNFEPVELCNLEYCQTRGSHIDAHLDDSWLWGERLVTLNLLSDSALTFTLDSEPGIVVRVPLQRRSLIVVSSAARHKWKHSILCWDVEERRLAMTFRELSQEFSAGGHRQQEGEELLRLALTFQGCAVSG